MNTLSIFIFFWNKTHLNLPNKYVNIHLQHQFLTGYMIFLHDQSTHNKSYLLFDAQHDPATKMIGLGLRTSWPNKPRIRSLPLLALVAPASRSSAVCAPFRCSYCSSRAALAPPAPAPLLLPLLHTPTPLLLPLLLFLLRTPVLLLLPLLLRPHPLCLLRHLPGLTTSTGAVSARRSVRP
jgi:hypothetical protein